MRFNAAALGDVKFMVLVEVVTASLHEDLRARVAGGGDAFAV